MTPKPERTQSIGRTENRPGWLECSASGPEDGGICRSWRKAWVLLMVPWGATNGFQGRRVKKARSAFYKNFSSCWVRVDWEGVRMTLETSREAVESRVDGGELTGS